MNIPLGLNPSQQVVQVLYVVPQQLQQLQQLNYVQQQQLQQLQQLIQYVAIQLQQAPQQFAGQLSPWGGISPQTLTTPFQTPSIFSSQPPPHVM